MVAALAINLAHAWTAGEGTTLTAFGEQQQPCANAAGINWCGGENPRRGVTGLGFLDTDRLVVARMNGSIEIYNYTTQEQLSTHDIQANMNNLPGEAGLTGMSVYGGDIYFSHNYYSAPLDTYGVAIRKLDAHGAFTLLYHLEGGNLGANAHNLHGPYIAHVGDSDTPVLIAPFGDLNSASTATDATTDAGKVLIMHLDGSMLDKQTFDTGHPNNMHLAYGNRNMFQISCLPATHDPHKRCLWSENGNAMQRLVFTSLLGGGALDLKWRGDDSTAWLNMVDPINGAGAVLHSQNDESCVFTTIMPELTTTGDIVFVKSCTGGSGEGRQVTVQKIANVMAAQPALIQLGVLMQSEASTASSPMATAVVPEADGELVIGDVFEGNLFVAENNLLKPSEYTIAVGTPVTQVESFCTTRPEWRFVNFAFAAAYVLNTIVIVIWARFALHRYEKLSEEYECNPVIFLCITALCTLVVATVFQHIVTT